MELKKLSPADFDQVYALMACSFPLVERRYYEKQKALLDNPYYVIYALYEGTQVRAFMSLWDFDQFVFFEHFAVHPDCRNGGVGAKMLRDLLDMLQRPVCLEVEPPDTELAQRRIHFYERNGFHLNTYPYMQLPLNPESVPIPLMIMSTPSPLTQDAFEQIRDTLYREVYGVSNP